MNFEIAPKSTEVRLNWNDAHLYCFTLNIDGKTGWRLPTINELIEIYYSQHDLRLDNYWSSTESNGNYAWAWLQNFTINAQYHGAKCYGGYYVRAIRDLP